MDAIDCGADFLGFNFYPDSPRYVSLENALELVEEIPSSIYKVGVFVNEDVDRLNNIAIALDLDFLQLHGDETPEYCNNLGRPWYKAFRFEQEEELKIISRYESEVLLVDAHVEKAFGGTGVVANWDLARLAKPFGKLILSGGLKPDNIEMALDSVNPYAVDVASGVESSPGKKDRFKMDEFIRRVKQHSLRPRRVP